VPLYLRQDSDYASEDRATQRREVWYLCVVHEAGQLVAVVQLQDLRLWGLRDTEIVDQQPHRVGRGFQAAADCARVAVGPFCRNLHPHLAIRIFDDYGGGGRGGGVPARVSGRR